MRRIAALLVALTLVLLVPVPAHAGSTSKKDANDTPGVLDLKKVSLAAKGKRVQVTFTTHESWSDADIAVTTAALGIDFWMGRNKSRGVLVGAPQGTLIASICTIRFPSFKISHCSKVAVERVSGTTLRVTVPRAKIKKGARSFQWSAGSTLPEGTGGCTIPPYCTDQAPNDDKRATWRP